MKIIEAGETCKRTCRFTCKNCGCIFEAEGDEMTIITNKVIRKPDVCLICTEPYVEAKCPWCGDTVEEPLNSVSLINLMRGVQFSMCWGGMSMRACMHGMTTCDAPMTDEAVEMVMERMEALSNGIDT